MEIIVCIKRVPDLSEAEIEIGRDGVSLDDEDLDYDVNEWDNFAIEAAVQLKEEHGGRVTAMTVGDEDAEDVLRRALAMGADEAVHLMDDAFEGSDALGTATILQRAIAGRPFDLILTGAISGDEARGHVGPMLAALLDIPMVALVTELSVESGTVTVRHEVEGGLERITRMVLPALVTTQTGLNEPRYVSIRGIRKVAGMEIPVLEAGDLDLDSSQVGLAGSAVTIEEIFLPPRGEGAEMLEGSEESVVEKLVERLQREGAF
ncbi:MAG: electron transfer flavoprotein subunit beta/FixA family protein [marine benthic group bacterium]|nr:electron transfer flavoprotein subunit beta/FixA family protein [Gemmatimonadota bacterium]